MKTLIAMVAALALLVGVSQQASACCLPVLPVVKTNCCLPIIIIKLPIIICPPPVIKPCPPPVIKPCPPPPVHSCCW